VRELSPAGRLAAWGGAVLSGQVSPDVAADEVAGPHDAAHRVVGLPGEEHAVNLPYALGRLRSLGVTGLRLVLPVPGDATGLPGPPAFNERAVGCGEAVVTTGTVRLGLLAESRGTWSVHDVGDGGAVPLHLTDAARDLTRVMREATELLVRLDLGRWDPAAAEALADRSRPVRPGLPMSADPQAQTVLLQGLRLAAIVELARRADGAGVTAAEMTARTDALRDLDRAARRAVEAACSATP
jgi:hypothetical protein